jgi:hypothetical protein
VEVAIDFDAPVREAELTGFDRREDQCLEIVSAALATLATHPQRTVERAPDAALIYILQLDYLAGDSGT